MKRPTGLRVRRRAADAALRLSVALGPIASILLVVVAGGHWR